MGKFHDDQDDNQYFSEQTAVESTQLSAQLKVEVGKEDNVVVKKAKGGELVQREAEVTASTASRRRLGKRQCV